MSLFLLAGSGGHEPPPTIVGWIWKSLDTSFGGQGGLWDWMGFHDHHNHNGMHYFEAIAYAIFACGLLTLFSFLATRKYTRVPRGMQNVMEASVNGLRGLVRGMMGEAGVKYLPYLGSLFLFIFTMNILGIIPLFRAPTMVLSTTLAMGIATFFLVQSEGIRAHGIGGYLKHFWGDMMVLGPLMMFVHLVGELAKPASLSLRLRGNIFGEDKVIETLLAMGEGMYIPLHFPMLLFAIFTSFLQAFIFTSLSAIYISTMTAHEDHEEHSEGAHAH